MSLHNIHIRCCHISLAFLRLPPTAACHPDTDECLWHCHLDVMSYFSPVTQLCCLSTRPSGTQQLLLCLMPLSDSKIKFFMLLGGYNPLK